MMRRTVLATVPALLLLIGFGALPAQFQEPTPYRLLDESSYQEGCFDECACPILMLPLRGTFTLEPLGFDGLFHHFAVSEVDWMAGEVSQGFAITGYGSYRVGGEFVAEQQLTLELQIGDDPPRHFDSGLVAGGGEFPSIDIEVRVGSYCYDWRIDLHARPAPRLDVAPESLSWTAVAGEPGYDVVRGELEVLRSSGGDFFEALPECLADDLHGTALTIDPEPGPDLGNWFLLRVDDGTAAGSYDTGAPSQVGSRDGEINASPASCP